MKKRIILTMFLVAMLAVNAGAADLLINEFVTNTDDDWVEIVLRGTEGEVMDISSLYVTMYYGSNEPLAGDCVTLCTVERPGTAFDDRFAVVHLTGTVGEDETDERGDVNGNGVRDLYCNNYSSSLWNSDGVVAIDTDDDPSNGGIIDFVAYSNRDGSMNSSIGSYVLAAVNAGEWICEPDGDMQGCSVDIGPDGLSSVSGIAREGTTDSNSSADFRITRFLTPGRENITQVSAGKRKLFRAMKRKIAVKKSARAEVPLFIYEQSNLRLRVFTVTGITVYESSLYESLQPGYFPVPWENFSSRKGIVPGMYIGRVEVTSSRLRISEKETIFIVVIP